jgi:hypothetical protein
MSVLTCTERRHRGWLIEQNWLGEWEATHPAFDPDNAHENRVVYGRSVPAVEEAIDEFILGNGE